MERVWKSLGKLKTRGVESCGSHPLQRTHKDGAPGGGRTRPPAMLTEKSTETFDLAAPSNRMGAKAFAQSAKGRNSERSHQKGTDRAGCLVTCPCKTRKDGAPSL